MRAVGEDRDGESCWLQQGHDHGLRGQISVRNAVEFLVRCSQMSGTREEAGFCRLFVEHQFEGVCKSEGFLGMPRPMLEALLSSDRLRAREEIVFDAALAWAEAQVQGGQDSGYLLPGALGGGISQAALPHLLPLLKCIRFPLMPPEILVLRVLNGKEAATCPALRELATEAVMWQAVPLRLRDKVKLAKLLPQQCWPRCPAPAAPDQRASWRPAGRVELAGLVSGAPCAGGYTRGEGPCAVVGALAGAAGEVRALSSTGTGSVGGGKGLLQGGAASDKAEDEALGGGGGVAGAVAAQVRGSLCRGYTREAAAPGAGVGGEGAASGLGVAGGQRLAGGAGGLRESLASAKGEAIAKDAGSARLGGGGGGVKGGKDWGARLDILLPDFHRVDDTVRLMQCLRLRLCLCLCL